MVVDRRRGARDRRRSRSTAVVDTTGAGDLYAAGFLYGLTHGYDLGTAGQARCARRGRGDLAPRRRARRVARRARRARCSSPTLAMKLPRYRTGDPELDAAVAELVDEVAEPANADLVFELVVSALRLGARPRRPRRPQDRERRAQGDALRVPGVRAVPRRAQGGDLRLGAHAARRSALRPDPRLAAAMADRDWMVITGAGPGIMEAGIEGAGPRTRSA